MHGKPSLKKSLQKVRRTAARSKTGSSLYVQIGRWRLKETLDGDLVISNNETGGTVVLARSEDGIEP